MNRHQMFFDNLINNLNKQTINFSHASSDGRINSIMDEKSIIQIIKDWYQKNLYKDYELDFNPKDRNWYDIAFINKKNKEDIIPINIKVTNMLHADNISSKEGLMFSLTGKLPTKTNDWKSLMTFVMNNIDFNLDPSVDYYFIVCNKTKQGDNYWTSLKSLSELTQNANNLPFQSNWGKNRKRVERTPVEAIEFVLKNLQGSEKTRANIAQWVADKCDNIIERSKNVK